MKSLDLVGDLTKRIDNGVVFLVVTVCRGVLRIEQSERGASEARGRWSRGCMELVDVRCKLKNLTNARQVMWSCLPMEKAALLPETLLMVRILVRYTVVLVVVMVCSCLLGLNCLWIRFTVLVKFVKLYFLGTVLCRQESLRR